MMEFSLWKNLKKRLKRKRRPVWMLGVIMFCLLAGWLFIANKNVVTAAPKPSANQTSVIQELEKLDGALSAKLRLVYVCGEESKLLGQLMSKEIVQLVLAHPEWKVMLNQEQGTVQFEERIEDLSEHCKANAYMGVDKKGNLTLYDGAPKKEKVVRTFFQLDVRYMESSLPQDKLDQLTKGIRITDMEEYNSVLSTYSDYAIEQNQKVMNPAYQQE
ncbi:BofC C-terminal domain-containing protein [Paenibacillus sp. FSL K6-3182]|uniref:BofC C-terminal domain-containing protein n=1 Tax=unclassified Paenibacillus TaxID=185978 RepID=UPI0030CB81C6